FPLRNNNLGSGSRVGSGNQLNQTRTAAVATSGAATYRMVLMLQRTTRPRPSSRESTKPSTKMACQVNGVKNHWPSTGQAGAGKGTVSEAKESGSESGTKSGLANLSMMTKAGATSISTT